MQTETQSVLRLPIDLHQTVKIQAVKRGTTMRQAIIDGLELWLLSDTSTSPAEVEPIIPSQPARPMADQDAELIASLTYINQRSAPAAAALRDLIRTLAREVNNVASTDAAAAAANAIGALSEHRDSLDVTGKTVPGADPRSPGHVPPGSHSTAVQPVVKKRAR